MSTQLFTWLIQSASISTVTLFCGLVVARLCKQPADRVRVSQWAMITTLAALGLACWPSASLVSLGLVAQGEPTAPATSASAETSLDAFRPDPSVQLSAPITGSSAARNSQQDENRTDRALASSETPPQRSSLPEWRRVKEWLIPCIAFTYVAGCVAMLLAWIIGRWRLRRLLQSAQPASPLVQRAFAQVAKAPGTNVRLLVSDEITAPVMWGLRHPVIMLPRTACVDGDATRLQYCLAHEWSHVVRRDFATWQLATALQVALYYHPLFWRMRRQLALSMDQLADHAASGQGGSATDYAEFLLELARQRLVRAPGSALGMSDKGCQLRDRIVMLVERQLPLRANCSRGRSWAIATLAIVVAAVSAVVRVDANPTDVSEAPVVPAASEEPTDAEAASAETSDAPTKNSDGSIIYAGVITDKVTGLPISGAKVSLHRRDSRDEWRILETTEHETNLVGVYSFTIPAEQVAMPGLYLEVEAHHPDYAAHGRSGYSHTMIVKNLEMGELPWFTKLGMWPGEAVSGTVVSPEGKPLVGVEVHMYSASPQSEGFVRGSFDKTTTDDQGRFRIVPPTPGDGVLWISPQEYSPVAYRLNDRRGDWGNLEMKPGRTISGRVLDVDGQPVGDVKIEVRRRGDGQEADAFLSTNAVANGIRREAVAGADGSFTLAALPDGEYDMQVQANAEGYSPPPLKQVFLRQSITIANGVGPEFLEVRAVPHVVISATYLNSKGKPRSGHEITLFGRWDGGFYAEQSSVPRDDGKLQVNAPHGLQETQLDVITNEHSALRWRTGPDASLRRGRRIDLGSVEDDVSGIEIIRYEAPILLVKPIDENGQVVEECQPVITYVRPAEEGEEMTNFTVGGHVSFEHQQDGRWRTSQLLPDEPITVTVNKEGYESTPQELSLPEGESRELEIVLKKVAAKP